MGERSLPSFDKVREALKGQRVGGILLGEPFGDEGHGAQGTVYRFENENFGQGGQPQYVAVKIMNYAEGMKEHHMYARAQSRSHPSDHIVKIFGNLDVEEKVCFFIVLTAFLLFHSSTFLCCRLGTLWLWSIALAL